jgi:phosphoglycerate dehydrogenase-like enzyme
MDPAAALEAGVPPHSTVTSLGAPPGGITAECGATEGGAGQRQFVVLYAEPLPTGLQEIVRQELPAGFRLEVVKSSGHGELVRRVAGADFVVAAAARIDGEVLAAAPRLVHVQHQGVGYDNVDVAACQQRGVTVALTPEGTTTGVAEHTFLLILALYKRLREAETALRAGGWPVWSLRSRSFELAGKTLGLVGFGRIGREVARRALAFDAAVLYYDPVRAPADAEEALRASYAPLDELLQRSDVVSLHLPLTPATRGLIGERELGLMRPTAVLINTARGPLVDEAALVRALTSGRLLGAGLDVFATEPPAADNPLLALDNVVVTPHIAAGTRDAFRTKLRAIFANLQRVARGEPPANLVPELAPPTA